jgi:hypothetical protein
LFDLAKDCLRNPVLDPFAHQQVKRYQACLSKQLKEKHRWLIPLHFFYLSALSMIWHAYPLLTFSFDPDLQSSEL